MQTNKGSTTVNETTWDGLLNGGDNTSYDAAMSFIQRLTGDGNTPVSWQTFDDCHVPDHKKRPELVRVLHGTLTEYYERLKALNNVGAGIYVTINETDLKGRKAENINNIRAIWSDDDHGKLVPSAMPLRPHLVVQTSPGKQQVIVLTTGGPLKEHAGVLECMVKNWGCDPGAEDLNRVLRVPGFYHKKDPDHPHLVQVTHMTDDPPYPWETIKKAYPPIEIGNKTKGQRLTEAEKNDPTARFLKEKDLIIGRKPDGGFFLWCPFNDEHTTANGERDCIYYPANTGGYRTGNFKCVHGHCEARTREDFLRALGYGPGAAGQSQSLNKLCRL